MKYCTQCGKALPDDTAFCISCGAQVSAAPAEPDVTPPQPEPYSPPVSAYEPPIAPAYEAPPAPAYEAPLAPAYEAPYIAPPARRSKSGATFRNTGLGFILIGVVLIVAQGMGMASPSFLTAVNIRVLFTQFFMTASVGFAIVLSARAKGPDLSIGAVLGLSATIIASLTLSAGSVYTGLLVALIASAVIGLINGVCAVYMRVPAVIITIVTGVVASGVSLLITQGFPIMVQFPASLPETAEGFLGIALILLGLSFAIAFLLVLFTRLGQPTYKRDKTARPVSFMFAYVASAVIAALAGFIILLRLHAAQPYIGSGYEMDILFIFAVIYSSRALDNRIAPVLFSMVPAWAWCVLSNALLLLEVPIYVQTLVTGGLTLIFVVLAFVCRYEKRRSPETLSQ